MHTLTHIENGAAFIQVVGPIDPLAIGAAIEEAGKRAEDRLVFVHLDGTSHIGIDAVNALLGALLRAHEIGGDVRLIGIDSDRTDLAAIVTLHLHFDIYKSAYEAVLARSRGCELVPQSSAVA